MEQLLATKLFIPPIRPELVTRSRLIEQLNAGLHHKLTLISAPAGFGKTTLVGDWLGNFRRDDEKESQTQYEITWLSLDTGDNNPVRFLSYFIAALNKIAGVNANFGERALSMLQSPQPLPIEAILTSLINETATIPGRIIIVLDDYHLIEAQPVHDALSFLLENQPPQMHLVIATREDPYLPLSRLRASSQMTEIRATDLSFTSSEAVEFFNQTMGLNLSLEDVDALETRTEGWIAGLQLAAVSMQRHVDTTSFIKSFTGSHRLVLDYLVEEVLEQQSESVQTFMLQTSILERLNGPLCDALTGQKTGQETLEYLEHANLFIVPLDNERRWYRYHHLFADLLLQRLRQTHLEQILMLHNQASEWYEKNGLPSYSIRHALAAEDFERAAGLIELEWRSMTINYQSATWLDWVKGIPDKFVSTRPVLSTGYGWALLDAGELEAAESRLRDAERWLGIPEAMNEQSEVSSAKMVVVDKEEFQFLTGTVANARAYLAQALGDVAGTIKYAQRALDLLVEDDYFERGLSALMLGFAFWSSGDLDAARLAVADAVSNMQKSGNIPFTISFTSYLADILIAQGHLHEAVRTYLELLEISTGQGKSEVQETAVLHLGLSELYLEQGDVEAAKRHLLISEDLGEQPAFPPWYRHWFLAQARMKEAQGNLDSAIEMLKEAERLYYRHPIPDVRPLMALTTRMWVRQGKLAEALSWARECNLSIDDDLNYLCEFEHVTLAKVLTAQSQVDNSPCEAVELLNRLLKAAEENGRMGSVIDILVQLALSHEAQGDIPSALESLERALILAEPEGYLRIFVIEGPPMARLLYEALSRDIAPDHVQRLLGAFPMSEPERANSSLTQSPESDLIEPISDRELEVLHLIADGLSRQEIAAQLFLSLNTVKTHARNIYSKLGVNNQMQAVGKARALGILEIE